jgi:phage baseplate assembly protein gpV
MEIFFGTITEYTVKINSNGISLYYCDVLIDRNGNTYRDVVMRFPYGLQMHPFNGQRVEVMYISDNNYICYPTTPQVYDGLEERDVVLGRLKDNITIKFTKDNIIIGLEETTKNVFINTQTAVINATTSATIKSPIITLDATDVNCTGNLTAQVVKGTQDVIGTNISLVGHKHTSSTPGTPTSVPIP